MITIEANNVDMLDEDGSCKAVFFWKNWQVDSPPKI